MLFLRLLRRLLRARALLVVVQLLLQRRVVHADQEGGLLGRHAVRDQRKYRCRERVAAFPGKRLAVDGRCAGARQTRTRRAKSIQEFLRDEY